MFTRCASPRFSARRIPCAFESTLATGSANGQASNVQNTVAYPYFVNRTRFQSLPVYVDIRNGKTRKLTLIRRIEGDIQALRDELSSSLDDSSVQIKSISGQLVIKGDRASEIREWLTKKGF
ncbi:mitochondrial 54S ribosomal protein img2 [Coemansia sp. IMI 209127]|nr:mitochondrial 54S ribosomal protein img2 [Coemansia sp. IMI 209127]